MKPKPFVRIEGPLVVTNDGVVIHCADEHLEHLLGRKHVLDRPEEEFFWISDRYEKVLAWARRNGHT